MYCCRLSAVAFVTVLRPKVMTSCNGLVVLRNTSHGRRASSKEELSSGVVRVRVLCCLSVRARWLELMWYDLPHFVNMNRTARDHLSLYTVPSCRVIRLGIGRGLERCPLAREIPVYMCVQLTLEECYDSSRDLIWRDGAVDLRYFFHVNSKARHRYASVATGVRFFVFVERDSLFPL